MDPRAKRGKRCKTSIITAARLIEEQARRDRQRMHAVLQDLTFADPATWSPKAITRYVDCIRQWCARQGITARIVWKLEAGERNGRIHYHVMVWLPVRLRLPMADKRGWWTHGMTRTERARNAVGYIAKYAAKPTDYELLPRGARVFALVGLNAAQRNERLWWQAPIYAREALQVEGVPFPHLRRAPGGGWLCLETGEVARSRWKFGGLQNVGGLRLLLLVEVPDEP